MARIASMKRIGPEYRQVLRETANITTTEALLQATTTRTQRRQLLATTGISRDLLRKWTRWADLMRIRGVGEGYAHLLEEAGLASVQQLALRRPENLRAALTEVNDREGLVRRLPSLGDLQDWVLQARRMPQVVGDVGIGAKSRAKKAKRSVLPAEERLINTAFASQKEPDDPLDPAYPLVGGHDYYFCFWIGPRHPQAMDAVDVTLPDLPPGTRLQVALFDYEGEIRITPGQDVGEIEIQDDLSVKVLRCAARPGKLQDKDLLETCLFFPVATPQEAGVCRLRCSIYHQQALIQSFLVRAEVVPAGAAMRSRGPGEEAALVTRPAPDYTLSNTLSRELVALKPHRLSVMINDNGNGTHGFRFFGAHMQEPFKADASFDAMELQSHIDTARGNLRWVSWEDQEPWEEGKAYRYEGSPHDSEQLLTDLHLLAYWGYEFYTELCDRIAAAKAQSVDAIDEAVQDLQDLMRKPGFVQIASKDSVNHVLPLGLVYDHPFDTASRVEDHRLCGEFVAALEARKPLHETLCFVGSCPSRDDDAVICPSGFWGYRHAIGMPISIGGELKDAVYELQLGGAPQFTMAAARSLAEYEKHAGELRGILKNDPGWHYADTLVDAIQLLKSAASHVVYFFCHGHVMNNMHYLEIGAESDGKYLLTPSQISSQRIRWRTPQPRPLVFINGCHTAALKPGVAMTMVSRLVRRAGAAGVIGTEISIWESLALPFAEECLRLFLDGTAIGEAVRRARWAMLADYNPLGLVYNAYVIPTLGLV